MPIPEWNEYGILPAGIHTCDFNDIEQRLAFNEHRSRLAAGLGRTLAWIEGLPTLECLIVDGSFVTDKELPGDIDAVAMIGNLTDNDQRDWIRTWQPEQERLKIENQIDLYPTVIGNGNDFSAFFQYLRPEEAMRRGAPAETLKGLLRIHP